MKQYSYILFCLFLGMILLGLSFISPGWLLVLDLSIVPFTEFAPWYDTNILLFFRDTINLFLWYAVATKLYYIFVFWFSFFVAGKLWKLIHQMMQPLSPLWITQATTSLFLICNPWMYERLITQPGIALGMVCITLGIYYLLENILSPKMYSLLWASLSFGFAWMIFPHAILLFALVGVLYIALFSKHISLRDYLFAPILILLPNINWLLGDVFYNSGKWLRKIDTFDWANIEGFIWNSLSWLGTEITHLLLYGFWGERFHIKTPDEFNAYWYLFWALSLVIIFWGNVRLYKLHTKLWLYLTSIAGVAYILALGISSDIFWPLSSWLYQNLPGYIGMREPQKWLGLTMIVFCICFVLWVFSLWKKLTWMNNWIFLLLVFVLLNTWNPMNIVAYQGQLLWSVIPTSYQELAKDELSKQRAGKYLVLPWHTYMGCSWSHSKNIASAQERHFYPLDTVVADNLEIMTKYSNSSSPTSKNVEKYLETKNYDFLQKENIAYIIYQKGCGYTERWDFLSLDPKLEVLQEDEFITLYQIHYEK